MHRERTAGAIQTVTQSLEICRIRNLARFRASARQERLPKGTSKNTEFIVPAQAGTQ